MKTCVWHDQEKLYVLKSTVVGNFANWVVRQSPVERPWDLPQGISEFTENLIIGDGQGGECTCAFLRKQVDVAIKESPTVVSWNDTPPGVDFIDLDALARNIAHSVWLETLYDNEIATINLQTNTGQLGNAGGADEG